MTLNDLWARFKVIDSINAAKMAKCSLVMTPTAYRSRLGLELLKKIFRAPVYRAHCAVIFAIAQLSCCVL